MWATGFSALGTTNQIVTLTERVFIPSGIPGTFDFGGSYLWADAMQIAAYDNPNDNDFSNVLWDLYVDIEGNIRWYTNNQNDVWGSSENFNLDSWNDLEIVADLANKTFTLSINSVAATPVADMYGWGTGGAVPTEFSWDIGGNTVQKFTSVASGYYTDGLAEYPVFIDDVKLTLPSRPGDIDGDGWVDDDDTLIMQTNWGDTVAVGTLGDLNRDGFVGGDDFNLLRYFWPGAQEPAPASVPEPGSLAMLAMGSFLLLVLRRRNRV